jgi:hypothetical protein
LLAGPATNPAAMACHRCGNTPGLEI